MPKAILVLLLSLSALVQTMPIIDNERVTVWENTAQHQSKYYMVAVDLDAPNFGKATYTAKGSSEKPRHAIVIDFKDTVVAPMENKSGYPDAFPREGIKKVLDNKRVTVWDYSWTIGKPTPMHFHAKDVVTIYMSTGEIRSTALDKTIVVNSVTPGLTKYNPRNRTHMEELIKGTGRAIIVELK